MMKKLLLLIIYFCLSGPLYPQAPQAFKYQSIVRDASGSILPLQELNLKFIIHYDNHDGNVAYSETHHATTNSQGLISVNIGKGEVLSGSFAEIGWGKKVCFLEEQVDVGNTGNFITVGNTQLLSVPYALNSSGLTLTSPDGSTFEIKVDDQGNLYTEETTSPNSDTLIDPRDGQKYPIVKIGDKWWMETNLNIGERIDGIEDMANNGSIEKYCYGDNPENCETLGGLYQWNEMMNYALQQGGEGICPPDGGWHIPTDEEWCMLEQAVDPALPCNKIFWRGTDGGTKLKEDGNSGFNALLSGIRVTDGTYRNLGNYSYFWTSSMQTDNAWRRTLANTHDDINRGYVNQNYGFSVRCVSN
jgi:uncharacterized protein (TIGR02145 family)